MLRCVHLILLPGREEVRADERAQLLNKLMISLGYSEYGARRSPALIK